MCDQQSLFACRWARPPPQSAFRQALVAQPESLPIIDQKLDPAFGSVGKQKQVSRKRVSPKYITANPTETVDPFSKIRRIHTEQNPHLWYDLNHFSVISKTRRAKGNRRSRWSTERSRDILALEEPLSSTLTCEVSFPSPSGRVKKRGSFSDGVVASDALLLSLFLRPG